jgi:MutL protein
MTAHPDVDLERPLVTTELSLLLDIGSAWTKAAVVGRARGRWRIVGHASQPTGWGEDELRTTLESRLRPSTDPRLVPSLAGLLAAAPRISCHTPRRAGRIGLAAVSADLSGAAAARAAESAGWLVAEAATADDGRSLADRLAALQAAEVDAWLLAGGFDRGRADQALEMAGLVAAARGASRAPVVWAGSASLADEVALLFEEGAVTAVSNARPSADEEDTGPLRAMLEQMLQRLVEPGGVRQLSTMAFRRSVAHLAASTMRRVVGVDLGARYLTWVQADETGDSESRIFAGGGLAAASLVGAGAATRLARQLPLAIDELAVADALQNLHARPATVPQTEDELAIMHVAARQLLSQAAAGVQQVTGIDLLIGAGRTIAAAPRPAQAAQLLLDGVRPLGVTQLALDAAGVLGPLGALEEGEIHEGMGVLRDDMVVPLGAAVVSRGGRAGQVAWRVTVRRAGWPEIGPIEMRAGQLQLLPLGRGQPAELEIELEPGVSLGAPREASRRVHATVTGGVLGLMLDARDVPLAMPRRSEDRRAVLAGWRETFHREAAMPAGWRVP